MLLLLNLKDSIILECPLDNIGLGRCALHPFTLRKGGIELAKVLKLDEVPNITEGGFNDCRLLDGCGGGDTGCHFAQVV